MIMGQEFWGDKVDWDISGQGHPKQRHEWPVRTDVQFIQVSSLQYDSLKLLSAMEESCPEDNIFQRGTVNQTLQSFLGEPVLDY